LITALNRADGTLAQSLQSLLEMPQFPPLQTIMDELINDLAGLDTPLVLVLDDYYVITNPQLHEVVEYFIDHQPAQIHLALTTRADPPVPLARLRARGQMTEIRAHDLRFTLDEAREFFKSMKLDLDAETIRALEARTEGWATGLQLAALALQNLPNPQDFIEAFRGSHRYVLDYLAEEVIRQQSEEIRQFLTQTSVLERFNAAACEALTGRADSQALLARLEQANLFVIPLDNERVWYRYHHLFADYLRTGLAKTEQADLYKKASLWHEENDLVFEAVRYALASRDHEFAAGVIERAVQKEATWSGGRVATLAGWLDALPAQALQTRPLLSLHASRILYLAGRFELAEKLLDRVEPSLEEGSFPAHEVKNLLALASLYRGAIASMRGEVQRAIEQTRRAQALLPKDDQLAQARAIYSLGLAYELSGKTAQSVQSYLQASQLAWSAGVLFLAINGRCAAAQAQITQGKVRLAVQTCQQAIKLAGETRIAPIGLAWSILGAIAYEQDDLTTAEKYLQDGVELSRRGGLQDDLIWGLVFLARLKYAMGDLPEAIAALEQANAIVQVYNIPRISMLASAFVARLQLAAGQIELALQWARGYQAERAAQPVEYLREFEDLTLARFLLANDELETVPPILDPLLEQAQAAGRVRICIETMILQALFHRANKNMPAAVNWLAQALRLAAPEGFRRAFLDEGAALMELLPKARPAAPEFVDSLLEKRLAAAEATLPLATQQPDPLSEQEMRVLKLVVAGKSNQEIAEELVITVGTAKWHVHNILQKLGVNNRPQAIARAHELGIG
jgi:LuxR family maltose regulon positive regulatory protein